MPAPGDEKAKTKESKYTKAYKARFGEDVDLQYVDDEFFMEEVDHLFPCEYEVLDEDEILIEGDNSEGLKKKSEKKVKTRLLFLIYPIYAKDKNKTQRRFNRCSNWRINFDFSVIA